MGSRGPQPKPTALRIVEGNMSHRPLPKGEPRPREIAPIAPEHLDETGRAFYERLIHVMTAVPGWLTEADFAVAAECANWFSVYRDADAFLRGNPSVYITSFVDGTGQEQKTFKAMPQVKIRKDAWVETLKLLDRLGLSPGSRARLSLSKRDDEDDDLDPD